MLHLYVCVSFLSLSRVWPCGKYFCSRVVSGGCGMTLFADRLNHLSLLQMLTTPPLLTEVKITVIIIYLIIGLFISCCRMWNLFISLFSVYSHFGEPFPYQSGVADPCRSLSLWYNAGPGIQSTLHLHRYNSLQLIVTLSVLLYAAHLLSSVALLSYPFIYVVIQKHSKVLRHTEYFIWSSLFMHQLPLF